MRRPPLRKNNGTRQATSYALAGKKALRSVLPSAICSALRRSGETGRRTGLKIQRGRPHVGSIPTSGTSKFKGLQKSNSVAPFLFLSTFYPSGQFRRFFLLCCPWGLRFFGPSSFSVDLQYKGIKSTLDSNQSNNALAALPYFSAGSGKTHALSFLHQRNSSCKKSGTNGPTKQTNSRRNLCQQRC